MSFRALGRGRVDLWSWLTIGAVVFWFLADHRYQVVSLSSVDAVGIAAAALIIAGIWTRRRALRQDAKPSFKDLGDWYAERSLPLIFALAGLAAALNGLPDARPAKQVVGTVTRVGCHKATCTLTIAAETPSSMPARFDLSEWVIGQPPAKEGDSIDVEIKPGALGRPSIASYTVSQGK
jgi:hypothetical protein